MIFLKKNFSETFVSHAAWNFMQKKKTTSDRKLLGSFPIQCILFLTVIFVFTSFDCIGCKKRVETRSNTNSFVNILPSSVTGIDIPGAHSLENDSSGKATILRGMTPQSPEHIDQLKNYGVKSILIFKNETKDEVRKERNDLSSQGFETSNIFHIPFRYKNFVDFKTPCQQTIEALKIIKNARDKNQRIYFHCTVGEDRTGFLAGIYRMLQGIPAENTFLNEMCANGYGSGNPDKPFVVVKDIQNNLTPLFVKFAYLISNQTLTWDNLDPGVCEIEQEVWAPYRHSLSIQLECPKIQ